MHNDNKLTAVARLQTYSWAFLLSLIVSILACNSESIPADPFAGKDFYPVQVGSTWIYAYDSVIYLRQFNRIDTVRGQLRETIESISSVSNQDTTYRLVRHIRANEQEPWAVADVWSLTIEDSRLIRNEENLPFIRLVFPPTVGAQWDGNAFIDESVEVEVNGDPIAMFFGWDSEVVDEIESLEVLGSIYANVVKVQSADEVDDFNQRQFFTYYAKGVGPIKQEVRILDCSNCDPQLSWAEKGDKGFTYNQHLISYSR